VAPIGWFADRSAVEGSSRSSSARTSNSLNDLLTDQAEQLITREGTGSSVKIAILLAALSLAPALILMTTCYVRVVVVLTLLRQAFGAQQLPSTQILTALSLFVTFLVMAPTWSEIKNQSIDPYTAPGSEMSFDQAMRQAIVPVKHFMSRQISLAKNENTVAMFYRYLPQQSHSPSASRPNSMKEVPLNVLMPAFLVSELKVAFLLGFQVYLPFLIVDLVVSSVTVSMGMVMLPPTMVSFPLKLILFVMVDGWTLVIGMLMQSFGPL
jgi:flagellar biosynthetic protein FliP